MNELIHCLTKAKQDKNKKLVSNINDTLINLRKNIYRKQIPENENPKKVVNIVKKILNCNKQRKDRGLPSSLDHVAEVCDHTQLKILTSKRILQNLTIATA